MPHDATRCQGHSSVTVHFDQDGQEDFKISLIPTSPYTSQFLIRNESLADVSAMMLRQQVFQKCAYAM